MKSQLAWKVYLSGEIHSDWRREIAQSLDEKGLPVDLLFPELDHGTSDDCAERIFGAESNKFWHDHRSAKVNAIRNRKLMAESDLVVVRFGEKYRQWNAAFDAGLAFAMGKSLVTLHPAEFDHALKEVDAAALAVARTVGEVIDVLSYCIGPRVIASP